MIQSTVNEEMWTTHSNAEHFALPSYRLDILQTSNRVRFQRKYLFLQLAKILSKNRLIINFN